MPCSICKQTGHNKKTCSQIPEKKEDIENKVVKCKKFYNYILGQVNANNNFTYNGYTVNLNHRLRQHQGIIKGGAYATRNKEWEFIAILHSNTWDSISVAMAIEWLVRYPQRKKKRAKKFNSPEGRILSLLEICNRIVEQVNIFVIDRYYELACSLKLPSNIKLVRTMEELEIFL